MTHPPTPSPSPGTGDSPEALLEQIQEDNDRVIAISATVPARVRQLAVYDVPRLLAAIGAVLEQADEWEQDAAYLNARADRESFPGDVARLSSRANAKTGCASELRERVRSSLAGDSSEKEAAP